MLIDIMQSRYMSFLDYLISEGLKAVNAAYISRISEFVLSQMNPDGGFSGRIGDSDLYYTDFALRSLSACNWTGENADSIGLYVQARDPETFSVVDCFNWLNCIRMLEGWGWAPAVDIERILPVIDSHMTFDGGFSKDKSNQTSVYATFLAKLCKEMLGVTDAKSVLLSEPILKLAFPDGGFAETHVKSGRQTNPTAAALSVMAMSGMNGEFDLSKHLQYIAGVQRSDGGLAASEEINFGDLLSTFSGVAVMAFLGNLELLDLRKIAMFLKSVEHPDGGFGACSSDTEADLEYTFYGLGVFGILRSYLINKNL